MYIYIYIYVIDVYMYSSTLLPKLDGNNTSSPLAMTTQEVLELLQSLQKEVYIYIIDVYMYSYIS